MGNLDDARLDSDAVETTEADTLAKRGLIGGAGTPRERGLIGGEGTPRERGLIGGAGNPRERGLIGGEGTPRERDLIGGAGNPRERGLIGGDLETRARMSRVPPVDHRFVLAPYRRDGDEALTRAFIAHRPLHVEIGFGRPHYLIDLARAHPEAHVLGFEIKREWVRAAAQRAEREGLENVRVIEGDARPHLERLFEPGSVDGLHVLFPDPWWKKRHHKRRVFTADFTALLARLLAPGGDLVTKTDVPAYVDQMIDEALGAGLELVGQGTADPILAALPRSHREKKCLELGVPFHMLRFQRTNPP